MLPTPNTGQLNPLFHTFAEFRLIVNRIAALQFTDCLTANAQFSPNENKILMNVVSSESSKFRNSQFFIFFAHYKLPRSNNFLSTQLG